jgi:pimeloyl-ACP methyl ester carboxylesterase
MTLIGSVGPVVERSEVLLALDRGENPLITTSVEDLDRLLHLVAEKLPQSPRPMRRHLGTERLARSPSLHALFEGWNNPAPDERIPDQLEHLRTPALVIHGERDRVIHLSTARALAERLPAARLEIMHGVGHVPQLEAPKAVAGLVDTFVAGVA